MELTITNQTTMGNCDFLGFSNAQKNIIKALELQGVEITAKANKTLCHIGAHMFNPDKNKTNYLWFPYEADTINAGIVDRINQADQVIASCVHNKKVFIDGGVTKPISICKLGIDTEIFKPSRKPVKSKKFRFLWIGNPVDMRKGWDIAAKCFIEEFKEDENVELYLKTTGKFHQDQIEIGSNIIFDSRNLATADLIDLYESSNVLLCTSRGEATYLPGLEAMSLKIPVMAPAIGGMKDFINIDTAISLEYEYVAMDYKSNRKKGKTTQIEVPQVKQDHLKYRMRESVNNPMFSWHIKGMRKYIRKNHSLKPMGERLINIIFNDNN